MILTLDRTGTNLNKKNKIKMEDLDLIDFKSSKETERQRQWEKQARQDILDRAKNDYERRQAKEEAARQRGETTWMLPSVEAKLGSEKSSKKKKKKEKKKKKKKSKKSKKYDSSSSSSESEEENSWVEKSSSVADTNSSSSKSVHDSNNTTVQQQTTRDSWMEMTSLFGTYTKEEMNVRDGTSRKVAKEEEERKKREKEKPGSHALELNPYYKNGGTGLPEEQQKLSAKANVIESSSSTFDAQWLRRALKRAQEQANEQGKSLEEVAAHRWGSLEKFYELLDEAEGKGKFSKDVKIPSNRSRSRDRESKCNDRNRNNKDRRSTSRDKSTSKDRRRHRSRSKDRKRYSRSRSNERKKYGRSRSRERKRSRSKEARKTIKRSRSRSRSKERNDRRNKTRRDRSSSSSSSSRSRSRSRSRETYSSARSERKGLGLMKPSDDQNPTRPMSMFMKPGEDHTQSSKWKASMDHSSTQNRGWQKKEFRPEKRTQRSPSSSSSSDSEDEKQISARECESQIITEAKNDETKLEFEKSSAPTPIFLNDKQMNELAAKIMKAEMLGNESQVAKLKTKMEAARAAHASGPPPSGGENDSKREEEIVLLTKTDAKGNVRPVSAAESENYNKKKRNKVKTHGKDGNRDRYFPDDDKYNLKSMFEKEKGTSAEEQNSLYERAIAKNHERLNDDYDVDDMFMDKATQREGDTAKQREMEQKKAIKEHQRTQRSLETCQWCFDSKESLKHLIVALGSKAYLSLPAHESLTPGHCIIVPIQHTSCAVQADEDIWTDVQSFRKSLVRLFESRGEDCIFFEMARGFRNLPHMAIHCIPLPKETGDMAPIYFKKAIMECEGEWAQNKKLVELKGRDVRRAIPKGLPYFFVDFAMNDGYAHVIEDEQTFPRYFAQEIIGGMLDVETNLWRKPRRENFDAQRRKVMQFSTWYKEFDPTQNR